MSHPISSSQQSAMPQHFLLQNNAWYRHLRGFDYLFAILIIAIAVIVQIKMPHSMDAYEVAILWTSAIIAIALGWFFKPLRLFIIASIILGYLATYLYHGNISAASDQIATNTGKAQGKFLLRYFLSSQSAIMWQCTTAILAFFAYAAGLILSWQQQQKQISPSQNLFLNLGNRLAWISAFAGFTGLLVRWHESYLLRPDAGHIPVSNLYEVFILFMVIMGLMYLYYERRFAMQKLGAFVYALMSVLVAFVLWYSLERGAHQIQPLIPALQSWWMKIHVPANFIGYGGFCMAAMFGIAQLFALRGSRLLPDPIHIEEAMYKAVTVGFLFFTIATILGAMWAKEAWGHYWSWDPKEDWALIVWLNYAVWLHMRLVAGWRGKILAWWAIIGLFITAFAFVGVNIFLTGLHAYGTL